MKRSQLKAKFVRLPYTRHLDHSTQSMCLGAKEIYCRW
uniref:Uncharacterized protein n=1 Tax=Arundo donax TaxID=35708 RepID=A0A0A8YJW5_ARUDO